MGLEELAHRLTVYQGLVAGDEALLPRSVLSLLSTRLLLSVV